MSAHATSDFNLGFVAASLRPELARIVAEHYLKTGDWETAKEQILQSNALQCRSTASARRLERELRKRLQRLTRQQLVLLSQSTADGRVLLAWLAAAKQSPILFDFAAETLRSKLEMHDPILRSSDLDRFLEEKRAIHPKLAKLTNSSGAKVRRVMLLMLREAGILHGNEGLGEIQRPVVPPTILSAVREDLSFWLAAFLIPDSEIAGTS